MSGGRKREFEKHQVIENAMLTFWQKGYTGTSLTDLTSSMGINKPSLYGAFGNKEQLFIAATEHYVEQYAMPHLALLHTVGKPTKQRLSDYLHSVIAMQSNTSLPSGCFVALCASESASDCIPQEATEALRKVQNVHQEYLQTFLEAEKQSGNLSTDTNVKTLTLFIIALIHGTAAMSRSGKSVTEIQSIIEPALNAVVAN